MLAWLAGAVGTALLGVAVHTVKKYIDHRIDSALGARLELANASAIARFEALVRLMGILREVDHALRHIRRGDVGYASECEEWSAKARREARAQVALIGESTVGLVTLATDTVHEYARQTRPELFSEWESLLEEISSVK